jgi:ABC-type transport system substrate-binding protein
VLLTALAVAAMTALACTAPAAPAAPGATAPAAGGAPPPAATAKATAAPVRSSRIPVDTLAVGLSSFPVNLDPHTAASGGRGTNELINDGLVRIIDDKIEPTLATAWRQVDDRTMAFTLRENVRFSNGRPFVPNDVKFSAERILNPANNFASIRAALANIEAVEVTGPNQVTIRTRTQDPIIAQRVVPLYVLSAETVAGQTPDQQLNDPIGTGPYRVAEYQPGSRVRFAQSPTSWRQGRLPNIVYTGAPESATRIAALRSGEVDLIESVPFDQVTAVESDGLKVSRFTKGAVISLHMNPRLSPLLADRRVREAIDLAINRTSLSRDVFNGQYPAAPGQPIPQGIAGYNSRYSATVANPERSRALLAEAGQANLTLPLRYLSSVANWSTVAEFIAGELRRVGVNVPLEQIDTAAWLQRSATSDVGPFVLSQSFFSTPDGDQTLSFFLSTTQGPNRGFTNPEFDRLLLASRAETNAQRREELLAQAAALVIDTKLYAYLYQSADIFGHYPNVENVTAGQTNPIVYERITKR